jgi:hypothetical protein
MLFKNFVEILRGYNIVAEVNNDRNLALLVFHFFGWLLILRDTKKMKNI